MSEFEYEQAVKERVVDAYPTIRGMEVFPSPHMSPRSNPIIINPREFIVKDSGKRQEFAGGMMRDTQEGKIDWWRVSIGPLMRRLAVHLTKGNTKYPDTKPGVPNWTLAAGSEEYARFRASAFRHFMQWYLGDMDEDHFAATAFNMNGAEFVKERLVGAVPHDA